METPKHNSLHKSWRMSWVTRKHKHKHTQTHSNIQVPECLWVPHISTTPQAMWTHSVMYMRISEHSCHLGRSQPRSPWRGGGSVQSQKHSLSLNIDGQIQEKIKGESKVIINKSKYSSKIIKFNGHDYYKTLRSKMNWKGNLRFK